MESSKDDVPSCGPSCLQDAINHVHVVISSSHLPGWKYNRAAWKMVKDELSHLTDELAATRRAAQMGMDAATQVSHGQLEQAQQLRAESSPEALASEREVNARLTDEIERLTRENKILEAKSRGTLANNLCPDHRDKQVGRPCLACLLEKAERHHDK